MTLPPFDGPRARQATATLNGEPAVAPAGAGAAGAAGAAVPGAGHAPPAAEPELGGRPSRHSSVFPDPPGAPGAPGFPGAPAAAPASRIQPVFAEPEPLNLSRRPFVNTRPVERVAAILWVLGVALLVGNLTLFMGYLSKSQATRAKLATRQREIAEEQRGKAELQQRLGTLGLDQENREVSFLNRKIDERTF